MVTYGSNGFGLNPLRLADIEAWFRMMRIEPGPYEVKLIVRLDVAYRGYLAEKRGRKGVTVSARDAKGVAAIFDDIDRTNRAKAKNGR